MADAGKKDKEKKIKRPSALKRDLQSEKRRLRNRSFRSSVNTAVKSLEEAIAQKQDQASIQEKLKTVHSIVDKGVKTGVFKLQKGSRTKSRVTSLATPK